MQTNDYDKLARTIAEALAGEPLRLDSRVAPAGVDRENSTGVERLIRPLASDAIPASAFLVSGPLDADSEDSDGSTARTVVSALTKITGLGPLATGLLSLFAGGSNRETEPVPAAWYQAPESVAVEAGLDGQRNFTPTAGYSGSGVLRSAPAAAESQAAPTIQIHVQAMDSRSFLDHSDDIARAVKEAMLHSHALNDVVTEL